MKLFTTFFLVGVLLSPFVLIHSQTTPRLVSTQNGVVQGFTTELGSQFLAIPYATPPVGNLRWKNPLPPQNWTGVYDATSFKGGCAQNCGEPRGACPTNITEDCLHLNIYTPIQTEGVLYPVYVFFHGGNFRDSSPMSPLYDSRFLANVSNTIVVIVGYRLGALGFLTLNEANFTGWMGIYDQWQSFEWIQNNIEYFGGDKNQVTIGGQSAGAISIGIHLTSPVIKNKNYFHRAEFESSSLGIAFKTVREGNDFGKQFAENLGCKITDVKCFLNKTMQEILKAQSTTENNVIAYPSTFTKAYPWCPVIGGKELAVQPLTAFEQGNYQKVPLLVGTNRDEGILFIWQLFPKPLNEEEFYILGLAEFGDHLPKLVKMYPVPENETADTRPVLSDLARDKVFVCPTRKVARIVAQTQPVFMYYFDHPMSFDGWGDLTYCENVVCHGGELPFFFDTPSLLNLTMTPQEVILSHQIQTFLGNFFHGVDMKNQYGVWPVYNATSNQSLRLNVGALEVQTNREGQVCDDWDNIGYV